MATAITLLNIDYKIATKCIAKRPEKVLPMLIDRYLIGYVKNRFIGENIRLISDVIESYEGKNLPGMLLFIDFKKVFYSLEWNFLCKVEKYSRSQIWPDVSKMDRPYFLL